MPMGKKIIIDMESQDKTAVHYVNQSKYQEYKQLYDRIVKED